MNLSKFKDLKYIGDDKTLNFYGKGTIWHCTNFSTNLLTGEMEFILQQPQIYNGEFMGYTGLDAYTMTREQVIENFKRVREDGSLENIENY